MSEQDPQQWEPKHDQKSVSEALFNYKTNPERYDDDDEALKNLEQHATYYRMPFARSDKHQNSFITKVIKQAAIGWGEGFTTLPASVAGVEDEPEDTTEAIARNLGHLAGFIGYLPGKKFFPALQLLKGKSVPMLAANKIQKSVSKKIKPMLAELGPSAKKFAEGTVLSDIVGGAFHLGVASSVSNWSHGVDEMVKSAGWGALFGGAFKGIGNMPGFGTKLRATQLGPDGMPILNTLSGGQKADLTLRTMAGMLFQGLPSTVQDQTTEEQVYNYLMGAYFGFKETPLATRASREHIQKAIQDKTGPYADEHPDWEKFTPEMQKFVKKDFDSFFGSDETKMITYDILSGRGVDLEKIEEYAKEFGEVPSQDPVTGELFEGFSESKVEEYRRDVAKTGSYEDAQDLDMHIAKVEDLAAKGDPVLGYVSRSLESVWKAEGVTNPELKRVEVAADVFSKWMELNKVHSDGIKRPELGAEKIIEKYISSTYGTNLSPRERGWWRGFAEQQRLKRVVQQVSVVDGEVGFLKGNTNAVGNKKDISFEPPLIEHIYNLIGGDRKKPFYTFFDHFIFEGKEYDLSRVDEQLGTDLFKKMKNHSDYRDMESYKVRNLAESEAKKRIDESYTKLHASMEEQDYYYFGGKGDAKRMHFVKFHPEMRQDMPSLKRYKKIMQEAFEERFELKRKSGDKKNKGLPKEAFERAYKEGLAKYTKEMFNKTGSEQTYLKSLISNAFYDVSFNGFNLGGEKMSDFKLSFKTGLAETLRNGYINDAKAFNKRAQIWFNTGLSGDAAFINKHVKDLDKFKFRYMIATESDLNKEGALDVPAHLQAEATDGAIIGRPDAVEALNLDKGLPTEGGANKSFIVDPSNANGALLGKYMIHSASPELAKIMAEKKIHFIMPESAVKQKGNRKSTNLMDINVDIRAEIDANQDAIYTLSPSSIRSTMSEKTDGHFIHSQKLPKQMYSTLSLFGHSEVKQEVFDDMYNTLSKKALDGTSHGQELLAKLVDAEGKMNFKELLDNFEELPIRKLMEVLRDERYTEFAGEAFKKILKLNDDFIQGLAEEGEFSRDQVNEERKVNAEFGSIVERLMQLYPDGSSGSWMHKFVRDYRMTAMRNYVVNSLTRPAIKNSAISRMRPLEPFMVIENSEIGKLYEKGNDDIFFLDDGHKAKRISDPLIIKGRDTLGEVWEDLHSPQDPYKHNKEAVEEILNAVVMRVPMDSMSGANVLKFQGFTGVQGFGSLLHPRAMRALGGADLDGDKAFVFFGGEDGMHKEWKKMYSDNRDEYVDGAPAEVPDYTKYKAPAEVPDYTKYKAKGWGTMKALGRRIKLIKHTDKYRAAKKVDGRSIEEEKQLVYDIMKYTEGFTDKTLASHPLAKELKSAIKILDKVGYKWGWSAKEGLFRITSPEGDGWSNRPTKEAPAEATPTAPTKELSKGAREMHNKDAQDLLEPDKTVRELFVVSDDTIKQAGSNQFSFYDPAWRHFMSKGAASGRDMLGTAVTNRAAIIGAYNAIRGHVGPVNKVEVPLLTSEGKQVLDSKGKPRTAYSKMANGYYDMPYWEAQYGDSQKGRVKRMVFETNNNDKALKAFRMRARATIALGSDPMDEAGLLSRDVFMFRVMEPLFKMTVKTDYGKKIVVDGEKTNAVRSGDEKSMYLVRKGLHSLFSKGNSLVYGKNWSDGRRWSYSDIQNGLEQFNRLNESSKNSLIPKLSDDLQNINWSDNVFRKVNFDKLKALYEANNKAAQEESWLKPILQRRSIGTPMGRLIDTVYKSGIWKPDVMAKYTKDEAAFLEMFNVIDRKGRRAWGAIPSDLYPMQTYSESWRRAFLNQALLKAEDFIINDMSDMTTLKRITNIVKGSTILPSRISEIHGVAQWVKDRSYINTNKRKAQDGEVHGRFNIDSEMGFELTLDEAPGERSVKVDQVLLDKMIEKRKDEMRLTKREEELFDTFMIGTFQRSSLSELQKLESSGKLHPYQQKVMALLTKMANNTALTRVGLQSRAVKDNNIKKFFNAYNELWKGSFEKLSAKEIETTKEELLGKRKISNLKDEAGTLIEGEMIERSDLSSIDKKYLDEIAPFRGLHKGKVKDPELREIFYEIKGHLDNMHNSDAKQINMLFRGVVGKDINTANKYDLKVFRNYLNEMNTPNWWRKAWDYMVGADKEIKRVYYWKFPAGVDRDLLATPGFKQLKESVAPYKDRLGNTIMGKIVTPMSPMAEIQQLSAKGVELALQDIDKEKIRLRDQLGPFVTSLPEGDILHDIAIAMRERGIIKKVLRNKTDSPELKVDEMNYEDNWKAVRDSYHSLKNKTYKVNYDGEVRLMKGEDVITQINKIYTKQNEIVHKWLRGNPDTINRWLDVAKDKKGDVTWAGVDKLRKDWNSYTNDMLRQGKSIPIEELGIDGLRQITKHILASFSPNIKAYRTRAKLTELLGKLKANDAESTGQFPYDAYYPHISFDRTATDIDFNKRMARINESPDYSKAEKLSKAKRLITLHRQATGDFLSKDEMGENFDMMQDVFTNMAAGKISKSPHILGGDLKKVGSQFSRDSHLAGWSRDPEAYNQYMKNIVDTFYRQAMQVANRTVIHEFGNHFYNAKAKNGALTGRWMDFFKLYTQSAMGYPAHIPEKVMNDPKMKIKGTPYKWFSDSQTKKRVDSIRKKLGVGRKALEGWDLEESVVDDLTGIEYRQLDAWSAMEAKWELASLLAHPKSAVANLYGGTVHTVINSGLDNWKNARSFEFLKNNVNPKWTSMQDVERWLQKLGVTEEFLIHEAGLNPQIKSKKMESFVKEVGKKLAKNPEMDDKTLLSLKNKYKLTDGMWDFAASFMRKPERILRRDAFMAHYLQARNEFGNAIKDFDHPFLIEMAKKGVKGTQFLYSAPYRPLWTNSALGRVFSRFQLWSWNSVRFRKDTTREARVYGLQAGTKQYDSFVRMAQADAFMLSLSSLFLYSLFENALPAPYNWFQDTADWFFGDEKDKDRAFYGSPFGPAQMVSPPSLRLLAPTFKWMLDGDSSKLTDYYLWTMLPFGRLARDIVGPGGMIENPYYSVTKMTGMPIQQMGDLIKNKPKYNASGGLT